MSGFAQGGYVSGPSNARAVLHPDECVINHNRECIRSGHPTATSDGSKSGAWWRCGQKP